MTRPVIMPWVAAGIMFIAVLVAAGCAGQAVRFTEGPVISSVEDTGDIPEPGEQQFWRMYHHQRNFLHKQLRLRLDPMPPRPAEDVNRLGEVPNSSWYENRIDHLTAADVVNGAGGEDPGPEAFKPWTIKSLKIGGRNPGFVFEDTRGARYIAKVDKVGMPVIATAAGAVAARLFWALGYYVPDDRVVFFERAELQLSAKLRAAAAAGEEGAVTDEMIDDLLASHVARRANGDYRLLVSRFLPGQPVGGYEYKGTRKDDPNDIIPHEDRRSLRGLRVFGAWLNHVDLKIDNTLDLYTGENGRRFIRHYLVDFDGCLGGYWAGRREQRIGYAYDVDLVENAQGLVTFGLNKRVYEDFESAHPYVGVFDADSYDPADWKANYLNDHLLACTSADAYWAGMVMGQIDRDMIVAAVDAARFEDEEAEAILADLIYRRWARTVDWALTRVTPVTALERIDPGAGGLVIHACDALKRFGRPSSLRFRMQVLAADGELLWKGDQDEALAEVTIPASVLSDHRYVVVRWMATDQAGRRLPPTDGHYRSTASGWQLAGILRDGQ